MAKRTAIDATNVQQSTYKPCNDDFKQCRGATLGLDLGRIPNDSSRPGSDWNWWERIA
jgi:hypothetical protein